jgi:manganese/zinc/iron transport system substrate-binding protein
MVADVARNVGGKHLQVSQLMGAGVDPHLYKASTSDIDQLSAADIIFYSGLHLEGKMGDVFVRMARRKPTFAITEGVPEDRILEVGDGQFDPHIWFDVSLWSETIGVVEKALVQLDPKHAADYQQNARRYRDELAGLHAECRERIATIPKERRVLVTAHDAFNYFGRAYDMEVKAIQGISTESEAGVKEINELVSFIAERKIKAVFVETSVSDRNIKALVEGCQAQGHEVQIGGELYSDAMGKAGTPDGTYVGMVRHNVETIVGALE